MSQIKINLIWGTLLIVVITYACDRPAPTKVDQTSKELINTQNNKVFVIDAAGNRYPTVKIGTQIWMTKNLNSTDFRCPEEVEVLFTNGIERGPEVSFYDGKPRYAFYNNDSITSNGVIYSYSLIDQCAVCPTGYRVPTQEDWQLLIDFLGGNSKAGPRLMPGGDTGFNGATTGRIDSYGSVYKERFSFWWSSTLTEATHQRAAYTFEISDIGVLKLKGQDTRCGNYVRCLKE